MKRRTSLQIAREAKPRVAFGVQFKAVFRPVQSAKRAA